MKIDDIYIEHYENFTENPSFGYYIIYPQLNGDNKLFYKLLYIENNFVLENIKFKIFSNYFGEKFFNEFPYSLINHNFYFPHPSEGYEKEPFEWDTITSIYVFKIDNNEVYPNDPSDFLKNIQKADNTISISKTETGWSNFEKIFSQLKVMFKPKEK